jgi:hypothetical protein
MGQDQNDVSSPPENDDRHGAAMVTGQSGQPGVLSGMRSIGDAAMHGEMVRDRFKPCCDLRYGAGSVVA